MHKASHPPSPKKANIVGTPIRLNVTEKSFGYTGVIHEDMNTAAALACLTLTLP